MDAIAASDGVWPHLAADRCSQSAPTAERGGPGCVCHNPGWLTNSVIC
jgi:hypothetical protein